MEGPTYDYICNIKVVGDKGSGRTSLINSYGSGEFTTSITKEFITRKIKIKGNTAKVKVYDQQKNHSSSSSSSSTQPSSSQSSSSQPQMHAIIITLPIMNSTSSLNDLKMLLNNHIDWVKDNYVKPLISEKCYYIKPLIVVAGTMSDVSQYNYASDSIKELLANNYPEIKYFKTSAKHNINIECMFRYIVNESRRISHEEMFKNLNVLKVVDEVHPLPPPQKEDSVPFVIYLSCVGLTISYIIYIMFKEPERRRIYGPLH